MEAKGSKILFCFTKERKEMNEFDFFFAAAATNFLRGVFVFFFSFCFTSAAACFSNVFVKNLSAATSAVLLLLVAAATADDE